MKGSRGRVLERETNFSFKESNCGHLLMTSCNFESFIIPLPPLQYFLVLMLMYTVVKKFERPNAVTSFLCDPFLSNTGFLK